MSLDGIDVFVEVAGELSFAKAAQRLGMPPATVSAKIARLERRLGVTLIQRTTRKLKLTSAGRNYYEHCVRAVAEIAEARRQLADASTEPTGRLRITAPSDFAQTVLPPLVERFLDLYPKMSVELIITNRVVDLLGEGIDLALRVGPLEDSTLTIRKFMSGRVGLWASQTYVDRMGAPQTPEELSGHRLIVFSKLPPALRLKRGSETSWLRMEGRLITDDLENARTFIGRGHGIGILPEFIGQILPDCGNPLVRILPEYASDVGSIYFAYPAQKFVPQSIRAFIGIATAERA